MNILIFGGTGLVGSLLSEFFSKSHQVKVFGRGVYQDEKIILDSLEWSDVFIQLSGATINKRWTEEYKKELHSSRIDTNKLISKIYKQVNNKPKVIFASAVGWYPESNCLKPLDESQKEPDNDFLSNLSVQWEQVAKDISSDVLIFRFGVVLSKNGGALGEMLPFYRLGLGGPVASGNQCFPWVHHKDLCRAFEMAIDKDWKGVFNLTSPGFLPQKDFGKALARVLRRPFIIPTFEWQLKMLFGEGASVLLKSLAVQPERLIKENFVFTYPEINEALEDIFN